MSEHKLKRNKPKRQMPAFVFFRQHDIELEGFTLAGHLIVDLPARYDPTEDETQLVSAIMKQLIDAVESGRMPDDAVVYGWHGDDRPPDAVDTNNHEIMEVLRELIPNAALFGVLATSASPRTDLQAAARTLGQQLIVVNARTDSDLETAFASFSQQRVGAVLVGDSNLYDRRMKQHVALAARHALAAIYPYPEYALAGGLMSYGTSIGYAGHQVGIYTGRILKGEKPADLPVEQSVKIELVINLKTAKALGLTIPETLLATADEVIQ
jgi:ABC-type uncharacterized transport system substrate-binding protein